MRSGKFFIGAMLFFSHFLIIAQPREISGIVKDATGKPIEHVSVSVKGTEAGTMTGPDGKFSITMSEADAILVFSHIGYAEKEVSVSNQNETLDITMEQSDVDLDAVVISASKKDEKLLDAPASVSVIPAKRIETQAGLTSADYLSATVGIDFMKTGLVSYNVITRGFNNTFSGDLLILTDNRISGVPSLKVNVHQLIPVNNQDIEKIEIVRGPGSALYGPNAANGVMHIITRSPLEMNKNFETAVSFTGGERAVIKPELRHAGKISNKFGYKISASYLKADEWEYYDPREPEPGDTMIYGSVRDGQVFQPDSTRPPQPFDRDFNIRDYTADTRFDFKLTRDLKLIVNGGIAVLNNIQMAEIGAGQGINWKYYYAQARLKWKELFIQYYLNSSNAGDTYIIPQVGDEKPPHNVQLLIDNSKLHVVQAQHSCKPVKKLELIYGADMLYTVPETGGSIHGRFDDKDNTLQAGGYIQAEYDIIPKLTLLGATRADKHSEMRGVFVSPRAALVYKPHSRHTLRATYNRAFSTPSTLNLFFDLSNGFIPNGINLRGIGNAHGYHYQRDDSGEPLFISPYTSQWYRVDDKSDNPVFFDGMLNILAGAMAAQTGFPASTVDALLDSIVNGIAGDNGTISAVGHVPVNIISLLNTGDMMQSKYDLSTLSDIEPLENSVTQTWEIGYKGMLFDRLSFTADFYHTRVNNYISPVTLATASVMFNPADVVGALGVPSPGGALYDNLQKPSGFGGSYDELLTGLIDGRYTDPTGAIPSMPGTSWDEIAVILAGASSQIPIGSVTPVDDMVNSDIILTYVNLGDMDVSGMDLGFNLRAAGDFHIAGGYSYMSKNKFDMEGAQLGYVALNAPRHKLFVAPEYAAEKIGLTARVTWRWQDGFPANSGIYIGYVKAANFIDIHVSYRLHFSKQTVITLDAQNILNYKHRGLPYAAEIGRLVLGKISHTF
ncbi:MAG TPA: TonB-dependent receptor [Chitinophagales bacterium]|nr:TonB-dependent receptor [Chitinophagales bacterium]